MDSNNYSEKVMQLRAMLIDILTCWDKDERKVKKEYFDEELKKMLEDLK